MKTKGIQKAIALNVGVALTPWPVSPQGVMPLGVRPFASERHNSGEALDGESPGARPAWRREGRATANVDEKMFGIVWGLCIFFGDVIL